MTTRAELAATTACRCLAARRTARALTRLYDKHLRPHGLRSTQFSILAVLALKGPVPMGELAGALGLERTTLTRSAALLQRKGWVRSVPPEDARKHPLQLTPAGRAKLESALPAWQAAQELAGGPDDEAERNLDQRREAVAGQDVERPSPLIRYPGRVAFDQGNVRRPCWSRLRRPNRAAA